MLDYDRDRTTTMIFVLLIATVIIFALFVIGNSIYVEEMNAAENNELLERDTTIYAENDTSSTQTVRNKTGLTTAQKVSLVIIILIPLVMGTAILGYYMHKIIKPKLIIRRKEKELSKRIGHTAYVNLLSAKEHINKQYRRVNVITAPAFEAGRKLEEIQHTYDNDPDSFDILMYKHQQGFISMNEMLEKAINKGISLDPIIINNLSQMVVYPHKDIVGDGLANKIAKPVEKEIRIQKELDRMYKD